jgi:hypothetical protein
MSDFDNDLFSLREKMAYSNIHGPNGLGLLLDLVFKIIETADEPTKEELKEFLRARLHRV